MPYGCRRHQRVYNDFIKAGATENEKPYNVGGDLMTATVKDIWGNLTGFIYNPAFKLK